MLYVDYKSLLNEDGIDFGLDSGLIVTEFNGVCAVNDMVPLALTATSPMYPRDSVIDIVQAGRTFSIGSLITCKDQDFQYGAASAEYAASYLLDIELADVIDADRNLKRDYKFKRDYVVVPSSNYSEYILHFRKGSGLWGSYTHLEDQSSEQSIYTRTSLQIQAVPDTEVSTDAEKDALWRSIRHFSPLERYLKLYHLLELKFDLQLVEAIRVLGSDLKGIGKLLNSYSSDKEFDRLLKIIRAKCSDIPFFENALKQAFSNVSYRNQWHEILFEYSKDSNPYKDKGSNFIKAVVNGFDKANWVRNDLAWQYDHLSKFGAYMVYRVRSSIAHQRIGEHLFSSADEGFVAEAAEPLLREIVLAVYRR